VLQIRIQGNLKARHCSASSSVARDSFRLPLKTSHAVSPGNMDTLNQIISSLGLDATALENEDSHALVNPLDICRAHLTKILVNIAGCSDDDALKSIQWPNNIFNGDFAVVLPRLRPGAKVNQLAVEIMEKVFLDCDRQTRDVQQLTLLSSQKITHCSLCLFWMVYTCGSLSSLQPWLVSC
jgi:hypothetical protein